MTPPYIYARQQERGCRKVKEFDSLLYLAPCFQGQNVQFGYTYLTAKIKARTLWDSTMWGIGIRGRTKSDQATSYLCALHLLLITFPYLNVNLINMVQVKITDLGNMQACVTGLALFQPRALLWVASKRRAVKFSQIICLSGVYLFAFLQVLKVKM